MRSDLIDFAPRYRSEVRSWTGHLPFAYSVIDELRPARFVELGTHYGESYFTFCQSVADNDVPCQCYAVDTWRGDSHAGFYDDSVYSFVKRHNDAHYASFSTLLRMTFDEALPQFEDGSIDLLHIDGLHTYEAVKHDFDTWLPKVKPGGVVLFHDTAVRDRGFGVWKLWEELSSRYPSYEFTHSYGLGVLRTPGGRELPEGILRSLLFDPSATTNIPVGDYFSLLGQNVRVRRIERDGADALISASQAAERTATLERKLRRTRLIGGIALLVALGLVVRALVQLT